MINCVCVCEPTLSGRLVIARVEGGGESRRRVGDVSVEMAASTAICEHSHTQHQDHTQQQGPHQTGVDRYTHTWGQRWRRDRTSDGQDVVKSNMWECRDTNTREKT